MKKIIVIALSLLLAVPSFAARKEAKDSSPVKEHLQNHFKHLIKISICYL